MLVGVGATSNAFCDALRGFPFEELHLETREKTLSRKRKKDLKREQKGERGFGQFFRNLFPLQTKLISDERDEFRNFIQ